MEVVFEQPALNVNISTKEIFTHEFKGFNYSKTPLKIKNIGASCGCLTFNHPGDLQPQSAFKIKVYLNKLNRPGLFSVSLNVDFENGEKKQLKLSGSAV